MEPSELGIVAFIESLIMLVTPLVIFGVDGSYSAFYHKLSNHERASQSVALLQIVLAMTLLLAPIFALIIYLDAIPIKIDKIWFISLLFLFLSLAINSLFFSQLQMNGKAQQYAVLKVCIALLGACITIFAVLNISKDASSRLLGIYSSPILVSFVCLAVMYKRGVFSQDLFRPDLISRGVYFGFGMVLHSWSAIVFFASDRFIIGFLGDADVLGKYAVAVQIGMVMAVIQNTFSQVWTPHSFQLFAQSKFEEFDKKSYFAILVLLTMCVALMMAVPLLYNYFIDLKYHEMINVTYWVVATYFFLGLYKVHVVKLFYYEKTKLLAAITTFTSVFNVCLTIMLIQHLSVVGAAIATFISSIVFYGLVHFFARKLP